MKPLYLTLVILALLLPGCGKDKVKPSKDYLLSQEVFKSMNAVKDAYLSKDKPALKNRIKSPLSESVINAMTFKKAELTFNERLVRITDNTVKVSISWQGSWRLSGEREFKNRGVADLVFDRENMKLSGITGDNPFVQPEETTDRIPEN
jgi:hypothetical protein